MIYNLKDLNKYLKGPEDFRYFQYADENYKRKKSYSIKIINKKMGGFRILQLPNIRLKKLQRSLLYFFEFGQISSHATAYKKGGSILENAKVHCDAKLLVKLDIENFYQSISFGNVYHAIDKALCSCPIVGALPGKEGNKSFNSQLSFYMSHICTFSGSLPQGAPTSPMLSNLVFEPLDRIISRYCLKRNISYTRYSDDLTFSGTFAPYGLIKFVETILLENGYTLNSDKTVIAGKERRQIVTGVVVNDRPQVIRSYRRRIRQELHYIGKYGIASHLERKYGDLTLEEIREKACSEIGRLLGKVNYVLQIDNENKEFLEYKKELLRLQDLMPNL